MRLFLWGIGILGGAVLAAAWAGHAAGGGLRAHPSLSLGLWGAALIGSLLATRGAARVGAPALWCGAILLRCCTLPAVPTLSDDYFRYLHEGRAARLGLEVPYTTAPRQVTPPPDDGISERVNHPDIPASYPPLTELGLWALVGLGDSLVAPRQVLHLFLLWVDGGLLWLLWQRRARHPDAFRRYAFHLLPLLSTGLEWHLDGVGAALCVAAWAARARPSRAGAWLGLAAGIKPVALLGLLALAQSGRRLLTALGACCAVLLLCAAPYLWRGAPLGAGLLEYATRWQAHPTVYAWVEAGLVPPFAERAQAGRYAHLHLTRAPAGLWLEDGDQTLLRLLAGRRATRPVLLDAGFFARALCFGLLWIGWGLCLRYVADDTWRWLLALLWFWLLTPTLHPWYLLWVVPLGAICGSRGAWWLGAMAPGLHQPAFHFAATGDWQESLWPRWVVLMALAGGLAWDFHRGKRARQAAP